MPTSRYNEANHRKNFIKLKGKRLYYSGRIKKLEERVLKLNLEVIDLLTYISVNPIEVLKIKTDINNIKQKNLRYKQLISKNKNYPITKKTLSLAITNNEETLKIKQTQISDRNKKIQEDRNNQEIKKQKIESDKIKISKYNKIITNIDKHLEKFDEDGNRKISNIGTVRRIRSSISRNLGFGSRQFVVDSKSRSDSNNKSKSNSNNKSKSNDITDINKEDKEAEKELEKLMQEMKMDVKLSNIKGGKKNNKFG